MSWLFFTIFVIPFLDLWLLARLALRVGVLQGIGLAVFSALLGVLVASVAGQRAVRELSRDLGRGALPEQRVIAGGLLMAAAILLIVPGLVSDAIALVLLVPFVRNAIARRVATRLGVPTMARAPQRAARPGQVRTEVGRVYVRDADVIDTTGEEVEP